MADLRVLLRAQSAVLFPGSTFSENAAMHRAARNATFGWVAELASRHLCRANMSAAAMASPAFSSQSGTEIVNTRPKTLWPVTGGAAAARIC